MEALVKIQRDDVFTDSLVIADGTQNEHRAVKQLIRTYENSFLELGTFDISNVESYGLSPSYQGESSPISNRKSLPISTLKSTGGRPEEYYNGSSSYKYSDKLI